MTEHTPDQPVSKDSIIAALRTVKDPELPVNLYDLGLIYDIDLSGADVAIRMTLTTPNCPVAELMPQMVQTAIEKIDGVGTVQIALVFEPAWTGEMMSEDARLQLEMMGISWSDPHHGPRNTSITISGRPRDQRSAD